MKFHFRILTLLTCLLCATVAFSQVKITGKVVDAAGEPIEFATVRLLGTAVGTNTDTKGMYEMTVPKADTVMVEFSCLGYSTVTRQLIKPEGTVTINPKLYEKTLELGEVEITEYKKQTTTMQGIDVDMLRRTPDASGGSVEAVLTTMAGVSSKNEMSSQYMVRGGSYDENSVYINGIEVYRPQLISSGQQEGMSIINPDMVRKVEFSTGGFSAAYGDRMSSVLDITYREPEAFEGALAASLQGGSLMLGHSTRHYSQMHGIRYKRNSSLMGSLESKGEYDPQYFDYQTSLVFKPTDKLRIALLGNVSINDYRFTPVNRETSFGTSEDVKSFTVYFDGYEKDKFQTYFGAGAVTYKFNDKGTDLTLQASGYRTDELVAYDIHGEYWLDQAGQELGVGKYHEHERTRLKMNVLDLTLRGNVGINNNSISYGLSMRKEDIYDRSRQWQWRDSAGYSLPHIPDQVNVIFTEISSNDLNTTRIAGWLMDTWRFTSSAGFWSLNAGVRLSHWNFNGETLISPRVSLGFVPERNGNLSLRLAGGVYYQAPFYKEYRQQVMDTLGYRNILLNKDIKSQRSIQVILGSDYTFRALDRPFKLTAEAYYKNLSNLIPYEIDNLKLVYSGVNSSKGYIAGVDMKLFGQFVEGTDSWLSLSLMKTQEDLNGVKVPRPTDQRYSIALFFTDYFPNIPRLKFSLKGVISDGLPTTAPHLTRADSYVRQPAYKRVDVGLSYELVGKDSRPTSGFFSHFKEIWLGLDVFNLMDISNVSSYYWVTDVNDIQYAVPNYLTRRQLNVRLSASF